MKKFNITPEDKILFTDDDLRRHISFEKIMVGFSIERAFGFSEATAKIFVILSSLAMLLILFNFGLGAALTMGVVLEAVMYFIKEKS